MIDINTVYISIAKVHTRIKDAEVQNKWSLLTCVCAFLKYYFYFQSMIKTVVSINNEASIFIIPGLNTLTDMCYFDMANII